MSAATESSRVLRELIGAHRADLETVLHQYGASNPRLFGSAARGDESRDSDIDIMVDLDPDRIHSRLLRLSGVAAGFQAVLHRDVDVVAPDMLRYSVSASALAHAVRCDPIDLPSDAILDARRERARTSPAAVPRARDAEPVVTS